MREPCWEESSLRYAGTLEPYAAHTVRDLHGMWKFVLWSTGPLRSRRDCLNLPKWRKVTEAACATFFLQSQIILRHISPLSESEVLTTDPWGKQRSSTVQGDFLKLVLACAWSKAIIWSQFFFFLSKWRLLCMNLFTLQPVCSPLLSLHRGRSLTWPRGPQPSASPCEGDTPCGSSSAMQSPLSCTAPAPPPVHLLFPHCTLGKWSCILQQTRVIPCSGSLLSYLPIEKTIANLACVTHEQLMEMTVFPSILFSLFSCPEERQQLSSTVDSEAW